MRSRRRPAADRSASTGVVVADSPSRSPFAPLPSCPAAAPRSRPTWAASTAKDNASRPMSHAGPTTTARNPARAGPTTMEAETLELTSALAASRWSGGRICASREYLPALPQACRTDEPASRATYSTGCSTPAAQASGTQPRSTARIRLSAASSRAAGSRRSHRPKRRAPAAPGSAYAASAAPRSIPDCPGERSRWPAMPRRRCSSRHRGRKPPARAAAVGSRHGRTAADRPGGGGELSVRESPGQTHGSSALEVKGE